MPEQITKIIASFFDPYKAFVEDGLLREIAGRSSVTTVKKGEKLLEIGQKNVHLNLLIKGCAHIYTMDDKGQEQTSWILSENDIAISVWSFLADAPSLEAIRTLETCLFLRFPKKDLEELYRMFPWFNYIGRRIMENYYLQAEEKANNLRNLSARERYNLFCAQKPALLVRAPMGIIASYLGITGSTLSRIRHRK